MDAEDLFADLEASMPEWLLQDPQRRQMVLESVFQFALSEASMPMWLPEDPGRRQVLFDQILRSVSSDELEDVIDQGRLIAFLELEAELFQNEAVVAIQETKAKDRRKIREECLEEELRKVLPLRNGGKIVAERGLACLDGLRALLADERQHFDALYAIALGKKEGIEFKKIAEHLDSKSITQLRLYGYIGANGDIDKDLEDVLWSSYQETKEGPVLTSPFKMTDRDEAHRLEDAKEEDHQRFMRALREKQKKWEERGGR